ncbi:PREDICTED: uncharacterized protein LOC104821233 [Tarenaya hassleriana]|uniref:uncharacterized protein LOC104821233 n=1 Tax=Tarenaya hassleriana TaxID=28532 RepID=UPI00053C38C8|nr:PREDICTED: uncharacterized protein LOC104821233 [Tarenaya hassleriana]
MEKFLNPYDKKYMIRMAMLKHEETFKHQVNELHRLYHVQKILMKNMEMNRSKQELHNNNDVNIGIGFIERVEDVDSCDVREDLRIKLDLDRHANFDGSDIEIIDESEIELTLGPTCFNRPRKKKPKKNSSESPENSDSRRSLSSSSTGSSNNRGNDSAVTEEQTRQEMLMKQQQPWLQVLSLNVT